MERTGKAILHRKMLVEFLAILGAIEKPDQAGVDKVKIVDHIPGSDQIVFLFKCTFGKVHAEIFPFRFRNGHPLIDEAFELLGTLLIFHMALHIQIDEKVSGKQP
jgi:hypothetical protein